LIAGGCNVFGGSWLGSAGTTVLELTVLDWFKQWLGYPESGEGLLTGGGSEANLLGILCARDTIVGDGLAAPGADLTDRTQAYVERALRAAGLSAGQIRRLPTDERFRISLAQLEDAIAVDRSAGGRPFLVVASAGTTNTGAIDPFAQLREVCDTHRMW